jgi:hypothetical protein
LDTDLNPDLDKWCSVNGALHATWISCQSASRILIGLLT